MKLNRETYCLDCDCGERSRAKGCRCGCHKSTVQSIDPTSKDYDGSGAHQGVVNKPYAKPLLTPAQEAKRKQDLDGLRVNEKVPWTKREMPPPLDPLTRKAILGTSVRMEGGVENPDILRCSNSKCRQTVPDDAKFCLQCGTKVNKTVRKCTKCGKEAPTPLAKFCGECGGNIDNEKE